MRKNRIRNFLRLRKQNDIVKIICILAVVGIGLFAAALYHVWGLYRFVKTPAEYVLTGSGTISKEQVDELAQSEKGIRVSRQIAAPMTLMYKGTESMLDCTMLSAEYLEKVVGVKATQERSTKRFYMNAAALEEWKWQLQENNEGIVGLEGLGRQNDGEEIDVRYPEEASVAGGSFSDDGDGGSSGGGVMQEYRTAKIVVIKDGEGGGEEDAFVYMTGEENQLREAYSLRVQFAEHDLDGLHVSTLRKWGYTIENEADVVAEEYEIEIELLHIRYGLLGAVICLVAVFTLGYAVRENKSCNSGNGKVVSRFIDEREDYMWKLFGVKTITQEIEDYWGE